MLNRTLKASVKKIKSAPKLYKFVFIAALPLIVSGIFIIVLSGKANAPRHEDSLEKNNCLKINSDRGCTYLLEIADSNSERIKGLSGKDSLADGTGMLFVFEHPDEQCFWMKEMNFSIDMLWLDSDRKIIKIEENVAPDTYPSSYCAENTSYVLELNAGEASKQGMRLGQQLSF